MGLDPVSWAALAVGGSALAAGGSAIYGHHAAKQAAKKQARAQEKAAAMEAAAMRNAEASRPATAHEREAASEAENQRLRGIQSTILASREAQNGARATLGS